MLSTTKTISLNGTSTVSVDGKDVVAMTMNASINQDGSSSTNKFIQKRDVYQANKETVDADYKEFETCVDRLSEV